jgi:hypothetical protein
MIMEMNSNIFIILVNLVYIELLFILWVMGIRMKKYDEIYFFKIAQHDDIERLMNFIGQNCRHDHIFAVKKVFLIYEHGSVVSP